jgi:formamidopyrimidine-DNA glycosylase
MSTVLVVAFSYHMTAYDCLFLTLATAFFKKLGLQQKRKKCIKKVLTESINNGGTTLNDFSNVDGEAGYFYQILSVYDRKDKPCKRCSGKIKKIVQNQRATYYCPKCQH